MVYLLNIRAGLMVLLGFNTNASWIMLYNHASLIIWGKVNNDRLKVCTCAWINLAIRKHIECCITRGRVSSSCKAVPSITLAVLRAPSLYFIVFFLELYVESYHEDLNHTRHEGAQWSWLLIRVQLVPFGVALGIHLRLSYVFEGDILGYS